MFGKLEKLKIHSFTDEKRSQGEITFEAQFNPTGWSRSYEIEFEQQQGAGNTPGPSVFKRYKTQDYTFELIFDGTGATDDNPFDRVPVATRVEDFLKACALMDGEVHRPRYLILNWGSDITRCVMKSAALNYTLFKPDGTPLRAKVTAIFSESLDEELRVAKENKQSPDLTRLHQVTQGETLPILTWRYYGDAALYARVARFNDLGDFREVRAGQYLQFPPLKQLPV